MATLTPTPVRAAMPGTIDEIPVSRLRALIRDFTLLLDQQMFFWGRDVIHPRGNLLCEHGFDRRKSEGLEGTSCYRKSLDTGGFIELHGACAGYYDPAGESGHNFLYIRSRKRCFLYSESEPPAPGTYAPENLCSVPVRELYLASLRFLDWWLDYENWIAKAAGPDWRAGTFRTFASMSASRPSLPPEQALRWLSRYRKNAAAIPRVRESLRSMKS